MRIVVAGAGGFLGGHIVDELLRHDVEIVALLSPGLPAPADGAERLAERGVEIVDGAEAQPSALLPLLRGADFAINAVQLAEPGLDPVTYDDVNIGAVTSLLDACSQVGVSAVCHLSSSWVYGQPLPPWPVDEGRAFRPSEPVAQSLATAERAARTYRRRVPLVIVRPAPTFGPRQDGLMQAVFAYLRERRRPRLIAGGRVPISLAYAPDLARAVWGLLDHAADSVDATFHVKSFDTDWRTLVRESQRILGRPVATRSCPLRLARIAAGVGLADRMLHPPAGVARFIELSGTPHLIDDSRLRTSTGFGPVFGLRAALRQTLEAPPNGDAPINV